MNNNQNNNQSLVTVLPLPNLPQLPKPGNLTIQVVRVEAKLQQSVRVVELGNKK